MGKTSKKNTEWFIKNSVAIHGDKYNYSKTEYKRSKENVYQAIKNYKIEIND